MTELPVAILNTSIVTSDGVYVRKTINLDEAKALVAGEFISYVGHPSTCEIMSSLLGVEVPMNRSQFTQGAGQTALVFKLNGRPEPGAELSREDLERIGFSFMRLIRVA